MKRLIALLLLSASAASAAETATLSINTVLRTADSLVILKAGTVVEILKHNEKTVTVKAGDKTGVMPWSALETETFSAADMMSVPQKPVEATVAKTPAPVAAPVPTSSATPAEPRKAQTMYGKAVEKAAAAAGNHEKAMVSPTDEILGGK